MHSLKLLCIYATVPAFLVTMFSFLLLRGYFLVFFGMTIFMTPALIVLFILFVFRTPTTPSTGYVLYTNNLTDKCNLKVLDYKEGSPWFATKGCMLTENSKPMIQQFIKSGGSSMRWQNACQMLRFSDNNLNKSYDKIIANNPGFDIQKSLKGEITYATSTEESIFIDKLRNFQKVAIQNLSSFRGDVPGKSVNEPLTSDDVLDLCSVKHLNLGSYKVY